MSSVQFCGRPARLASTITSNYGARRPFFSSSNHRNKEVNSALLVLGAVAAGAVGTLAYQRFTTSKNPTQTNSALPAALSSDTIVPDLSSTGPSDKIEYSPTISTEQVNAILNNDAFSYHDMEIPGIEKYDGAQVGSNATCEDAFLHGRFSNPLKTGKRTEWMAWGVFDGHNGWQTSALLAKQLLPHVQRALQSINPADGVISDEQICAAIGNAFKELDGILVKSAKNIIDSDLSYAEKIKRLEPAEAGACALLTLYNPFSRKLYVASTGDCRAVMGYKTADGKWKSTALTKDQTGANPDEIARLKRQFPKEPNIFLRKGRVYGMEPSRSFGDGVYKWNTELRERLRTEYNAFKQPAASRFPGLGDGPYLTASPIVTTIQLPEDGSPRFLIQATDGLWDMMGNQNAVDLVSRWSELQGAPDEGHGIAPGSTDVEPIKFGRVGCWYSEARATYQDSNAAVHLIRNGFGGKNDEMVRGALSFTSPLSRWIRDDVTVQVVFFDGGNK